MESIRLQGLTDPGGRPSQQTHSDQKSLQHGNRLGLVCDRLPGSFPANSQSSTLEFEQSHNKCACVLGHVAGKSTDTHGLKPLSATKNPAKARLWIAVKRGASAF
jgi:hypothetical protein